MFISLLIATSSTFTSAAEVHHCQNYLDSNDYIISDSFSFNSNLANIDDAESLERFILILHKNFSSLSIPDKKTFLRSGLVELENISGPFLNDISISARDSLLRVMGLNSHKIKSASFFTSLQNAVLKDLPVMKPQDLSSFIFFVGKLGIKPSSDFLNEFQKVSVQKIQEFEPKMMSTFVFGFGQLGVKPTEDLLKAWRERYKKIFLDFDKVNIVNSIFSFYLLGATEMVKWFARATPESQWSLLKNKDHIERRQVSLVFEYYLRVHTLALKPIQRFQGHFKDLIKPSARQISEIEGQYEMRLAISGVDYEKEFKTLPGFYLDFYIPEENKVIQIDGPSHFIQELTDGTFVEFQRPQDNLMDEILRSYGYRVKRVSYKSL